MVPIPRGLFDNLLHKKGWVGEKGFTIRRLQFKKLANLFFWTIHAFIINLQGMSYKMGVTTRKDNFKDAILTLSQKKKKKKGGYLSFLISSM